MRQTSLSVPPPHTFISLHPALSLPRKPTGADYSQNIANWIREIQEGYFWILIQLLRIFSYLRVVQLQLYISDIYRDVGDSKGNHLLPWSAHDSNTQNVQMSLESEYKSQRWLNVHEFSNMNKFLDIALFLCGGLWCWQRTQ